MNEANMIHTPTPRSAGNKTSTSKARVPPGKIRLILSTYVFITLLVFVLRLTPFFQVLKLDTLSEKMSEMFADMPAMAVFGKVIHFFFTPKGMILVLSVILLIYVLSHNRSCLEMFFFKTKSQISTLLRPKPIFERENRVFLRVFDLANMNEYAMDLTNEERHVLPLEDSMYTFSTCYEAETQTIRLYRNGEFLRALTFDRKEKIDNAGTIYIKALLLSDN